MSSARTYFVIVLAAGLLAAGCGGGSKKVDPVADLAVAKSAVLTSADLSGYKGTPHTASDDIPAAVRTNFAACMKAPSTVFDDSPGMQKANSENFANDSAQISTDAEVYPKRAVINDRWQAISQAAAGACLEALFKDGAQSDPTPGVTVTFGDTSVTRFDPGVGKHSVGYSVKLTLKATGQTAVFYADVVFLQRDRAGVNFEFVNINTPLDRAFETGLVQKVYDRIGNRAS